MMESEFLSFLLNKSDFKTQKIYKFKNFREIKNCAGVFRKAGNDGILLEGADISFKTDFYYFY